MFFAGNRSRPWQLAPADARELLTGVAHAPGYHATNHFDPTNAHNATRFHSSPADSPGIS